VLDEPPQRLDERLVGNAEVLVAAAGEDEPAGLDDLARELGREARLANAGLPTHQHDPEPARRGLLPRAGDDLALVEASDVGEWVTAVEERRKREVGGDLHVPCDLVRGDRRGKALERELADAAEVERDVEAGDRLDEVAAEDLVADGRVAEAGRRDDRRAEDVAALDGHVADGDPDAHVHGFAAAAVVPGELPLDRHRGLDRVARRLEDGHDPVAGGVGDVAVVGGDRAPHQAVVGVTQLPRRLLAEAVEQVGGADEVGEQDRHRAPPRGFHVSDGRPGGCPVQSPRRQWVEFPRTGGGECGWSTSARTRST
jgi:hypothetical protein